MKALGYIALGTAWMIAVVVQRRFFGGFGIGVSSTSQSSIAVAFTLLNLIMYGWTIPLTLGIFHLFSKR